MRILILTNLFPNEGDPERGIFVKQLADALSNRIDVTVVSPLPYFPDAGFLRRFSRWQKFAVVPFEGRGFRYPVYYPKYPYIPKVSEYFHPSLVWIGLKGLRKRFLLEPRFDVINAQWLYPDVVAAAWFAESLNVPLVATGHGCDVNRDLAAPRKSAKIIKALGTAGRITVVSQPLRKKLLAAGIPDGKIRVIPNGVDPVLFPLADRERALAARNLDPRPRRILFVGQLVEVKGIPNLVGAVARLREASAESFVVHLLGDGPLLGDLKELAVRLGVGHLIHFEGQRPHHEVAEWMGVADLLVLPSIREGCPNVVLEALSSGIPVVAARVGGIPDLVDADGGILVEPDDSDALARAIGRALTWPWDRAAIRAKVVGKNWSAIARQYEDVYRETVAEA